MSSLIKPSPAQSIADTRRRMPLPCDRSPPAPRLSATSSSHLPCPPPLDLGLHGADFPAAGRELKRRRLTSPSPIPVFKRIDSGTRRASMHSTLSATPEILRTAPLGLTRQSQSLPSFHEGFGEIIMNADRPAYSRRVCPPPAYNTQLPPRIPLATRSLPPHLVLLGFREFVRSCGHEVGSYHGRKEAQWPVLTQQEPPQQLQGEAFRVWREQITESSYSDHEDAEDGSGSDVSMEDGESEEAQFVDDSSGGGNQVAVPGTPPCESERQS